MDEINRTNLQSVINEYGVKKTLEEIQNICAELTEFYRKYEYHDIARFHEECRDNLSYTLRSQEWPI